MDSLPITNDANLSPNGNVLVDCIVPSNLTWVPAAKQKREKASPIHALVHFAAAEKRLHVVATGLWEHIRSMDQLEWLAHPHPQRLVYAWMTPTLELLLVNASRHVRLMELRYQAEISMRMPHHGPELPSILDLEEGASKYVARRSILLWAPDGLVVKGWDSPPIVLSFVGVL